MRRIRKRELSRFQAGVITIVALLIIVYFGFTKSVPFTHQYTVHALFTNSQGIVPKSLVRIAGVNVGQVKSIEPVRGDAPAAMVDMTIQSQGLPLHQDATFKIRPRTLLEGNFFVDVTPGSPTEPVVGDGHTFPVTQTANAVQLDQILHALPTATRSDLQTLLQQLSKGLSGRGAGGYNASIRYWQAAYQNGAQVNEATLGEQQHDLSDYIRSSGAVAQALDTYPAQLKSLVTDFNTTAHAFAIRQNQLSAAVAELPRTLSAAMPALAALNRAFPPVRRFAREWLPAVHSSGPAIDASLPFLTQLRGLLSKPELRGLVHDLSPTVPQLAKLNAESLPLYEQTRAASSCQNNVILPWTHDTIQDPEFPATGPVYQESTKPLVGLSGESREVDANGTWFRVLAAGANLAYPDGPGRFLLTNQALLGTNPPPPAERSPLRPTVPCETQQPPDLRTIPGELPSSPITTAVAGPAYDTELAKAQQTAVDWLRQQINQDGLSGMLAVSNTAISASDLSKLKGLDPFPLHLPVFSAASIRAHKR